MNPGSLVEDNGFDSGRVVSSKRKLWRRCKRKMSWRVLISVSFFAGMRQPQMSRLITSNGEGGLSLLLLRSFKSSWSGRVVDVKGPPNLVKFNVTSSA